MRKNLICFLSIVLFCCAQLTAQEPNNVGQTEVTQSAVISIEGMACQEGCADAINANLEKISGVISSEVSFATGQANINFNRNEISIDSLKSVITNTKVKDYVYSIKDVILEDN